MYSPSVNSLDIIVLIQAALKSLEFLANHGVLKKNSVLELHVIYSSSNPACSLMEGCDVSYVNWILGPACLLLNPSGLKTVSKRQRPWVSLLYISVIYLCLASKADLYFPDIWLSFLTCKLCPARAGHLCIDNSRVTKCRCWYLVWRYEHIQWLIVSTCSHG